MKYSKTQTEWETYLDEHDVDLVNYSQPSTPSKAVLTIRCRTCSTEDVVMAGNLVRRTHHPCGVCSSYQFYSTESIKKLIAKHGGIYLGGEVTGKESLVKMICCCGSFIEKKAHDIRRSPTSCKNCRHKNISRTQLMNNQNLTKANAVATERGGFCLTKKELVTTSEPLEWQCKLGHTWTSSLGSVAGQGTWCPTCNVSTGENMVRVILEAAYELPFPITRPEFLADLGQHLDGYHESIGLAFENQGIQHYEKNARFHSSKNDLYEQMERDVFKALRCRMNGVTLLTIPYYVTTAGLKSTRAFLSKILAECGVPAKHDPLDVSVDTRKIYDPTEDQAYQDFKQIVASKGGHYDEATYLGLTKQVKITCAKGHVWEEALPHLVRSGHWCSTCAENKKLTVAEIQGIMKPHHWSLVSPETLKYKNAH